jgi:hypothetical protein
MTENELRQYASALNKVSSSLSSYGVDMSRLMLFSATVEGISGASTVYKGAVTAMTAIRAAKTAEYAINLAKWGPYAAVIAPIALAAGYAAGKIMDRYSDMDLSTSEGQRSLTMRVLM